jgi:hypothetical protein
MTALVRNNKPKIGIGIFGNEHCSQPTRCVETIEQATKKIQTNKNNITEHKLILAPIWPWQNKAIQMQGN